MEHRLLILGTAHELARLAQLSKERGYYTVVCDDNPDGPARAFADRGYLIGVREIDRIAELCREERIDRIVTSFSDVMFECMVKIAARAGLPCYISEDQLPAYRDKQVTKSLCRRLGIRVPRYQALSAPEERPEPDFPFPAVVKPMDSYGSRGLTVVWSMEEIPAAFAAAAPFSGDGRVLIESMSRGQELNCMACVTNGRVRLISVADRMTCELDRSHIPVDYANIYPSRYLEQAAEKVTALLQTYVNETGQKWGPVCTQCFFDGTDVEVCEITARFFGFEHELVTYSSGLDMEELLLDLAYSPEKLEETFARHNPRGSRHAAVVYLQSVRSGVLADQSRLEQLAKEPWVEESILFYRPGDSVGVFGPRPYFARYYVTADTREALDEKTGIILERAGASDENGQELLFRGGCETKSAMI